MGEVKQMKTILMSIRAEHNRNIEERKNGGITVKTAEMRITVQSSDL